MSEDSESRERALAGPTALEANPACSTWRRAAAWILGFTFLVLIFGAFNRASFSGDGCGQNWPGCMGTLLPVGHPAKTWIEVTHRYTSGLLLVAVLGLFFASTRIFPRGHIQRRAAGMGVVFTLVAAAIGAALVLNKWVVYDTSMQRAITMPLHLINNYFLLASLILTVLPSSLVENIRPKNQGGAGALVWASAGAMWVLGATGAVSAMGKTAFAKELETAQSLAERVHMHVGDAAHPILKGGVIHPLIATSAMLLVLATCFFLRRNRPGEGMETWAKATISGFVFQMGFGVVNLFMSAPLWMQMVHLALALGLWGAFVMMGVHAFQRTKVQEGYLEAMEPAAALQAKAGFLAIIKQYLALTKPRVISLLLFTTVLAMVIANGSWPPVWQMLLVALGGYMAAGAANTYNMVVERDLDVAMERTSSRPTVTQAITNGQALVFATLMMTGSFVILTLSANFLAASLALAGLLFYVFIYTLLLKRRTWQNIVIGGAAGAFPPLVGYAAVKGELSPFAWILFAIIFFWTPVHFWALAILIKEDYAKAGVPMLPVVKGDHYTVVQIVIYAVLTALISIIPLFQREVGMLYLGGMVLLNLGLIMQSLQLMRDTTPLRAKVLFKYSMVYLALVFVVTAADRAIGLGS
jgi:protoheme IX farnesyltransferase